MAIDKNETYLRDAKDNFPTAKYPKLLFEQADVKEGQLGQLQELGIVGRGKPFDAVFLDINGTRELSTVVATIQQIQQALKPKLIIVKSKELAKVL